MSRAIRFQPDILDHALIDFSSLDKIFSPTSIGLILNESATGCSLIIKTADAMLSDQVIRVQVGKIGPLEAKIVWSKVLEESVVKVGIQFIE